MSVLSGLEPAKVFDYFEKICSVPHGSGNTRQISDLCVAFAKELGLRWKQDEVNNVVIWKDASQGYEKAAPIILQGHIDMVCVKTADSEKDMALYGLDLMTDGLDIWADKTSLGGDNGIAVAMILAVLSDDSLPHPPIEAVFTVDEEVGMDGAFALDCSELKGKKLINLDSEEEGVFTVSCAGGLRADCELRGDAKELGAERVYSLTVSGLKGGHSGGDIDKGRASANTLMSRTLYSAMEKLDSLCLVSLRGGQFDNVICDKCLAVVAVSESEAPEFERFIVNFDGILKNEYVACDSGVSLSFAPASAGSAMSRADSERMLSLLMALPQGVQEMSWDFEGLVQTSLNLGVLDLIDGKLSFTLSIRSCIASQKEMVLKKIKALMRLAGGAVSVSSAYPGWQFMKDSSFRELILAIYQSCSGKEAVLEATHGGLECGLFIEKIPGLDAISMGPELHNVHSVNERLNVASTGRVYELLLEILKQSRTEIIM